MGKKALEKAIATKRSLRSPRVNRTVQVEVERNGEKVKDNVVHYSYPNPKGRGITHGQIYESELAA